MKIKVDATLCTGHAMCALYAPDVYELDDFGCCASDGKEVPPEQQDAARKGANACPEQAITLSE